jgi:hypothetical protein
MRRPEPKNLANARSLELGAGAVGGGLISTTFCGFSSLAAVVVLLKLRLDLLFGPA